MLPAIQLTLKNLQLDYLDLYLIHSPFAFRHDLDMSNLQEEDKLGYDESRVAGIWKVTIIISLIIIMIIMILLYKNTYTVSELHRRMCPSWSTISSGNL